MGPERGSGTALELFAALYRGRRHPTVDSSLTPGTVGKRTMGDRLASYKCLQSVQMKLPGQPPRVYALHTRVQPTHTQRTAGSLTNRQEGWASGDDAVGATGPF